jgi:glutamine synthetase
LLNPGHNPHENAIFLTILCAIIKAIDKHADILRASVACTGNTHRLGGNEAPPAIISMFLGDQLTDVIEQIEKGGAKSAKKGTHMRVGVDTLPELPKDVTDRNRTSPFAFTGNKFEFRAVGSTQSCAGPNIVLNTIVAETLDEIATALEPLKHGTKEFNDTLQKILQKIIKDHKRIIFNGDNYSKDWVKEAKKRELPNITSVSKAWRAIITEKAISLFSKYKVLNKAELHSRYEIFTEEYAKITEIEGKLGLEIAKTMIYPAAVKYQTNLLGNLAMLTNLKISSGSNSLKEKVEKIGKLIDRLADRMDIMQATLKNEDSEKINKSLESLRGAVDALEIEMDDSKWPLPKYSEMLFIL